MTHTLNTTQAALASLRNVKASPDEINLPLLGRQINWKVKGGLDVEKFRAMWVEAGLDPKLAPKEIRSRSCVLRTLQALEVDGFVREIRCDKEKSIWLLVDEAIDTAAETAEYDLADKLIYDKKAKTLTVGRPDFQSIVNALMEQYKSALNGRDIRSVLLDAIKAEEALTMGENGGFYFVPADKLAIIDKIEALFAAMNNGSELETLDLYYGKINSRQVLKNFRTELVKEMDAKLKELEKLDATPVGKFVGKREKAINDRLNELKLLGGKISLYSETLSEQAEDLDETRKAIMAKATEMLDKL